MSVFSPGDAKGVVNAAALEIERQRWRQPAVLIEPLA
jgi:hypothetical protein